LQFLAGFEANGFAGRYRDFRTGTGIPADPGFTRLHSEYAETPQLDPIALFKRPLHLIEDRLDGHLRLRFRDTGLVYDFVDDVEFDQKASGRTGQLCPQNLPWRSQLDDRIEFSSMSSKTLRSPGMRSESDSVCAVAAAVSPAEFRDACSRFTTGITIVTCLDEEGHPHGMTVNSFTSVSLEPPLVLVSIDLRHAILGHFLACPWFAVNVLAENQERLSHRFSSVSENRFIDVDWHSGESGMPLLVGVLAQFECAAVRHIEIGDHAVLVGEVRRARSSEGRPLIYFDRSYRLLGGSERNGLGDRDE
jgi:flavin reductase (DIM6/NTAB) family NADH-FMN oxidoreductase RutF